MHPNGRVREPGASRRVHEGLSHIALARERTYLPYVMHKHGRSTMPDTYAARAYTHIIDKNAGCTSDETRKTEDDARYIVS